MKGVHYTLAKVRSPSPYLSLSHLCMYVCMSASAERVTGMSFKVLSAINDSSNAQSCVANQSIHRACSLGEIQMVWRNAGGICERKILFWIKKEADQAGFKDTRTGPQSHILIDAHMAGAYALKGKNNKTSYVFSLSTVLHRELFNRWQFLIGTQCLSI